MRRPKCRTIGEVCRPNELSHGAEITANSSKIVKQLLGRRTPVTPYLFGHRNTPAMYAPWHAFVHSPTPKGDREIGSFWRKALKRSLSRVQHGRQLRIDGRKAVHANQRPQRGLPPGLGRMLTGKRGRDAGSVSDPQ